MRRYIEFILLLPVLLFIGYGVYLYITSGGERWNPISLPTKAHSREANEVLETITPVTPVVQASLFNFPAPVTSTATHTPRPASTSTTVPPTITATLTTLPSPTATPVITATLTTGASVPAGLRNNCGFITGARFDWFILISPCEMVTGEVTLAYLNSPPEGDGDYEFNVQLDSGQESYLSPGNDALGGTLHAEITEADQRRLVDLPKVGQHIALIGAWVQNTHREGWYEFNPVWYWVRLP